jgi:uncharacterized protein (TIGR03118 family)
MDTHFYDARLLKAGLLAAALAAALAACGGGYSGGSSSYMAPATPLPAPPVMAPASASKFLATSLVSDASATPPAAHTDAKLVNAWGIAFNPTGFVWVANNGTSSSTLYDGNGVPQSLVVAIPAGASGPANPTGIVFNGSQDFKVTQNGVTGAASFIFVGEGGTISGWSSAVNRTAAVTVVNGAGLLKGLALASYAGANYLYAADFDHGSIDVYNGSFAKVTLPGNFRDPTLPAGYAPFGIQAIGGRIYVAYAKQAASGPDEVKGAGLGVVAVFDTSGGFIKELAAGGALNAPWGLAIAPANFGSFSNMLLVANFGDGKINAYDPASGAFAGTVSKADGTPIVVDGLWGIAFGNGVDAQPTNTLFYTAGPGDEAHGIYGRIDLQ